MNRLFEKLLVLRTPTYNIYSFHQVNYSIFTGINCFIRSVHNCGAFIIDKQSTNSLQFFFLNARNVNSGLKL